MKIAILALQGAFREHEEALSRLGADYLELRERRDLLASFDGLIIPGGESTVQGKLLRELDMFGEIRRMILEGLPVFGTCAGLILLAERIENDDHRHLATMDITAIRNAYGRQLGSFYTEGEFDGVRIPMTFIRAPYISRIGAKARELARVDGKAVAAVQEKQLVCAFHPELGNHPYVHQYFLNMIAK